MIFAKNFARNYEKKNTWNIRRLVVSPSEPATQRIILKIVGFQEMNLKIKHIIYRYVNQTDLMNLLINYINFEKHDTYTHILLDGPLKNSLLVWQLSTRMPKY